jgi:D-alanine-D-alanine ligase
VNAPFSGEKIAVLAGGPSCEREISLLSGKAVAEALRSRGFDAALIDPVPGFQAELRERGIRRVFLALHGAFGEDGTVQRLLEKEGIAYTGSGPAASETAFDKARAQALFRSSGIPVPDFRVVRAGEAVPAVPVPCVVKPAKAGSSVGITIVRHSGALEGAVREALRYSDEALIENYVQGRELTVGILGDRPLPIVEILPKRGFYDYEAKYGESGTTYDVPAKLTARQVDAVTAAGLAAYRALGCSVFARTDVLLDGRDEPWVLEVNTIPGLTGKSLLPKAARAAGIDFPDLCVKILQLSVSPRKVGVADGQTG